MMVSQPGIAVVVGLLTLGAVAISLWRIGSGTPTQRTRGCVSLVVIVGMLVVVIAVYVAFLHAIQATGPSLPALPPGSLPPTSAPINGPSFGTPGGGGSLP